MSNGIKEIWFTTTAKGTRRAWHFDRWAFRAMPLPLAKAELLIATEQATRINKPDFVGAGR